MPLEETPHETVTRALDDTYTVEYDADNRFVTLFLTPGNRLSFAPTTARKLRDFLLMMLTSKEQIQSRTLSSEYRVTYNHGLLTLQQTTQQLAFSVQATQALRAFLSEQLTTDDATEKKG